MGLDASHLASSVAKSLEVERAPGGTQRTSEIAQEQLAGESAAVLNMKKPDAAVQAQREKIRRDRERRRRESERRVTDTDRSDSDDPESNQGLDVVA